MFHPIKITSTRFVDNVNPIGKRKPINILPVPYIPTYIFSYILTLNLNILKHLFSTFYLVL